MTPVIDQFNYGSLPTAQIVELRATATTICSLAVTMTSAILDIGCRLIAAKQALPHGRFSAWVETECGFTHRTAQNYMRVAKFADGKSETVSLLTPSAIYALASEKTPPAVVHRVLQLLASHQVPTECDVLRMLAEARQIKAERSQAPNGGPEAQNAADLAAQLLETVGPDFARSLAKGPWDKIGIALRTMLCVAVSSSADQCRSAANVAPTSTHVDLERDPHDATLYRPKTSETNNLEIPPELDRRAWASGVPAPPLECAK